MDSHKPVVFGSVGLGAYAGSICELLESCSRGADAPVRLAAICEPDNTAHGSRKTELRDRGVKVFDRYEDLLALPEVEAVWLPLPIDLHRPFTEKALAAGKAVMCEKPAAGSVDDLDAMIAARDRARLPVAIGFQDVYDATTMPLKRELLAGTIGKIEHATVHACWPRGEQYYSRATWAGRFRRNGVWVMDSPANNALAHYLNIPLFLMGPTPEQSAEPVAVEAELYRANPIENFDTISARVTLAGGATLLVLFTHACERTINPEVVIHGQRGAICRNSEQITVTTASGVRTIPRNAGDRSVMVRRFADAVRGRANPDIALATLEVARSQLVTVNGASEATSIVDVPPSQIKTQERDGTKIRTIAGIEAAFEACVAHNRMLHAAGLLNWTRPAGHRDLRGYRHFAGPRGVA